VFLLSVLQGVAEFLPISSSGHLVLGKHLLGLESPGARLEVALHVGTLFSVLAFYRESVLRLTKGVFTGCGESWRMAVCIAVSIVPAVLFYLIFRKSIDASFESTRTVGIALLFTGAVLFATRWLPKFPSRGGVPEGRGGSITLPRAVLVGIAQAVAILPGVSRSGMTISMARAAGVAPEKAAEFSFLMSLPLIAGAALQDALSSAQPTICVICEICGAALQDALSSAQPANPELVQAAIPYWLLAMGAVVAGVIGYVSLKLLVRLLRGHHFWMFGVYCIGAGALTLVFLN
jgi:undecaprenyl-diphosphatase